MKTITLGPRSKKKQKNEEPMTRWLGNSKSRKIGKKEKLKIINYISPLYQAIRRLIQNLTPLLLLALLFVSCVNDEYVGGADINGTPVSFSTNTGGGTRAVGADAAMLLGNSFTIFGSKKLSESEMQPVFSGYVVNYTVNTAGSTNTNTADWEYVGKGNNNDQTIKYWDFSAEKYYFSAYSLGKGDTDGTKATANYTLKSNALLDSYTLSGSAAQLAACYITNKQEITPSLANIQAVKLSFLAFPANIRIGLYETIPGFSVKDVKFYSKTSDATPTTDAKLFANNAIIPNGGTYTVTYDESGSVKYTHTGENSEKKSIISTGALESYVDKQLEEADGQYLGRTSNASTITSYQPALPNPDGCVLNIKVDYKLVSIDGSGQEIKVTGASAVVPAAYTTWKSNFAYTYIFKINDNTNGYTGDPSDEAGLYPITFDAWTATGDDNSQGTITTFGDYSITTYQEGYVEAEGVGYKAEKQIDITVIKNTSDMPEKIVLDGLDKKVRVVLQTTNNESEVGSSYPENKEQTVAYNNGVASFTPRLAGCYRVEYSESNALIAVKIVKVGEADITAASL